MTILLLRASRHPVGRARIALRQHESRHSSSATARAKEKSSSPSSSSSSSAPSPVPTPLLVLRQARLAYPEEAANKEEDGTIRTLRPTMTLAIHPPSTGGHAVLGKNGTGKTLLTQAIAAHPHRTTNTTLTLQQQSADEEATSSRSSDLLTTNPYIVDGTLDITAEGIWHSRAMAHVSFASHQELLRQGGTASKAISEGGNLTKAAKFLVVRFGLFPLLQRDVTTLSTGEIRKVLLVRALAHRPRLLLLDNAFDGLDVPSRETLKELVSKTLLGFTQDILVQAVQSNATAHTQIVLVTHRAEEIVPEIETVSLLKENGTVQTNRREGQSGLELLQWALLGDGSDDSSELTTLRWDDPRLPSPRAVHEWWALEGRRQQRDKTKTTMSYDDAIAPPTIVRAQNLSIERGGITLLHNLNWTVKKGERWLVAGGNGAGKSTLSRLLARPNEETIKVLPGYTAFTSFTVQGDQNEKEGKDSDRGVEQVHLLRNGVGYVSTEYHMQMAASTQRANDILLQQGASSSSVSTQRMVAAERVAEWMGIQDEELLARPFCHLSQGQQKMILIAAALASRPLLLVLDEPCQGLDLENRQRVLTTVERICQETDMSLVYITHHFEEVLPSMTHVLHLKDRRDVFHGKIKDYDPHAWSK